MPGQNIFLADSPGFDDTFRNDATILQSINECLSSAFEDGHEIVGLLYLHPITEVRMKGSARKNLILFGKIVGMRNMSKTILVTTKWHKDNEAMSGTFESRERELVENANFWKPLLDRGSSTIRFNDTMDSALQIVSSLCGSGGFIPQLVDETVNRRMPLEYTAAGQEVNEDLEKAKKAHQQDLQDLKNQQLEAFKQKDHDTAKLIKEAQDEVREQLQQIESERKALREKQQRRAQNFEDFLAVGAVAVTGAATIFTGGLAAPLLGLSCYNLTR